MPALAEMLLVLFAFGLRFAQQEPARPSATPPPGQNQPQQQATTPLQAPAPAATSAGPAVLKKQAWDVLQTGAKSDKATDRAAAIHALGLITHDRRAQELGGAALKDGASQVRLAAAAALGEMHARESIPKLKSATGDKDPSVGLAAAHALLQLNDPAGYEVYYEVLTGERKTGKGILSEAAALKDKRKLAEMGFEEGIGFIPFAGIGWHVVKKIKQDDPAAVRAAAATVLVKDADPQTTKALLNATGDKSWIVRTAALEALAKRDDPSVLNTIQLYLPDEKNAVKYVAAAAALRLTAINEAKSRVSGRVPKRK